LCDLLDIGEIVKTPVRKLSLGQRIRCELACSLIHEPSYLFLDEPTIGLDLLTQEKIYNFLKTENRLHQTTIILTSHNVRDIEALAQRLLILSKGELIFNDSLNKLPLQIDQSDSYCLKYWINDQTDVREEIIHDPQQLFVKMEKFQPEQIISLSKSGISAEEVILKIYQREKQ
jgi:ABC-2 type transport system ATP-binding protein